MQEPKGNDHSTGADGRAASWAGRGRLVLAGTVGLVVLLGGITLAILSRHAPEPDGRGPAPVSAVPTPAPRPPREEAARAREAKPTRVHPAQPAPSQPVRPAPGATRPPAKGASLAVQPPLGRFKDPSGSEVTFFRDGTVRATGMALPPELAQKLYRVYVLERVPAVDAAASGVAEPTIRLTSPDPADASLESATPVFRWTAIPGVESYSLTLERLANTQTGEWVPVDGTSGKSVTAAEWVVPADAPLARGTRYRWRVGATHEGDTLRSTTVDFRVLAESELRRLNEVRERYGNIPYLLGPHYEELGFYEEATWEYLKLARANPDSPQAQRALENAKLRVEQRRQR